MAVDDQDSWARQTAGLLVGQLRQAGIVVLTVNAASSAAAGLDLAGGRVDLALLNQQTTPYPTDALAWYTPVLGPPGLAGSEDWTRLDDPQVTGQLTAASQELNPNLAQPSYQQADGSLWNRLVDLPLFTEPSLLSWSTDTVGVGPNPYVGGLLEYPETWGLLVPAPSNPHGSTTTK
jgi:ABC-type transport system substrate-binding protein